MVALLYNAWNKTSLKTPALSVIVVLNLQHAVPPNARRRYYLYCNRNSANNALALRGGPSNRTKNFPRGFSLPCWAYWSLFFGVVVVLNCGPSPYAHRLLRDGEGPLVFQRYMYLLPVTDSWSAVACLKQRQTAPKIWRIYGDCPAASGKVLSKEA